MMKDLDATIFHDGVRDAGGGSVGGHVIAGFAGGSLDLPLWRLSLKVRKGLRAGLLDAGAATGDIGLPFVVGGGETLDGAFARQILAEVPIRAGAFDGE